MKGNDRKQMTLFILASIVVFFLGAACGAYWFNHRKVYDKECFSTIENERDFLREANMYKYKLIFCYDGALGALKRNDTTEAAIYKQKIDSLWNCNQ